MSLRIGVVGCGAMGRHHVRLWSQTPDCELTAIYDVDSTRAGAVAEEHGCEVASSLEDLADRVDAATVAVPTTAHLDVGLDLLRRGIDVLMEKPIAATLSEADELIEAAGDDRILAIGHTERFNPVVRALLDLVDNPRFLEVHRLGSFPDRSTDVDAILDLMVHDLDIILRLVNRPLVSIEAVGVPVLTGTVDIANARLSFEGGCVANLTASRVSREQIRKLRLFQSDTYISVDYSARSGRVTRLDRSGEGRPKIVSVPLAVDERDSLEAELRDFAEAVRTRQPATVPGWEGRRALDAAIAVRDAVLTSLSPDIINPPDSS